MAGAAWTLRDDSPARRPREALARREDGDLVLEAPDARRELGPLVLEVMLAVEDAARRLRLDLLELLLGLQELRLVALPHHLADLLFILVARFAGSVGIGVPHPVVAAHHGSHGRDVVAGDVGPEAA
jgi:hypothetical protein